MIRVAVSGCAGRMGQAVVDAVTSAEDMVLVCGIDPFADLFHNVTGMKV